MVNNSEITIEWVEQVRPLALNPKKDASQMIKGVKSVIDCVDLFLKSEVLQNLGILISWFEKKAAALIVLADKI